MKKIVDLFRELWAIIIRKDQEIVLVAYKAKDEDVWHKLSMQRWQVPRFSAAFHDIIERIEVCDEEV